MKKPESEVKNATAVPSFIFSMRFVLVLLAFWGYFCQILIKVDLGMGIVCMVNHTAVSEPHQPIAKLLGNVSNTIRQHNDDVKHEACFLKPAPQSVSDGPFVWSKPEQGIALGAYFWGFILTQIPGGWISAKYGGRNLLAIANLAASLLTLATPFFSNYGYLLLSMNRFLIGLCHGVLHPAFASLYVQWAPASERSKIVGTSISGAGLGAIVGFPLASFLCVNGFAGGWPSIFYVFGMIGVVWSILLMLLITDSPKTHKCISSNEREYILKETVKVVTSKQQSGKIKMKTPWKGIFTSKVAWATFTVHFLQNFGHLMYLTQLPSFMKDILKFDIKSNGLFSAIPYICNSVAIIFFSIICDRLIRWKYFSRKNVRKIFTTLGLLGPMIGAIGLAFVTCSTPYLAILILSIAMFFNGMYWGGGPMVNIQDIAGPYSGVINGITNTFATLPGIVFPYIVGVMTINQTQHEWSYVFIICACFYFLAILVFCLFAESELQPWAINSTATSAAAPATVTTTRSNSSTPSEESTTDSTKVFVEAT